VPESPGAARNPELEFGTPRSHPRPGSLARTKGLHVRYWALVRAGFRRWSSYRAATVAGMFTNIIFGFVRAGVTLAAIAAAGPIAGYDKSTALTYTWLTQGMIMTVAMWRWVELATRIQTGDVVIDLQRPIDPQTAYLAEDLGRAGYQAVARGVPPFLVGAVLYHLQLPASVGQWAAFAISVTLAVVVSFGWRWLVNLTAFWVLDFRGLNALSTLCVTLLSGFVLPLAFFPQWAERLMTALPFASMIQVPIDVFLGRHSGAGLAGALTLQLAWAVALLAIGRFVLSVATRRVVVQGG